MRRARLQRTFLVALLLVGLLPGIMALAMTYWSSTRSLKQSIGSGFQEIARSAALRIATAVDGEIEQAVRLSLGWLPAPSVGSAPQPPAASQLQAMRPALLSDAYLKAWAAQSEDYLAVMVADATGAIVATSEKERASASQHDQPWWRDTMTGGGAAYVGPFRPTVDGLDYAFEIAVPLPSRSGLPPPGVVRLLVRRTLLMKTVLTIRVGETGHGMLVDTDGTPLICPVLPPTHHLIHKALLDQLATETAAWFVAEDDAHGDHQTIVGSAPVRFAHRLTPNSLGGHRWYAFVRQQAEETYAPIYSLLTTVGSLGLILVLGLALAGSLVGARLVAPLNALRREAEDLERQFAPGTVSDAEPASRSADPAPHASSTDEILDLAHAFQTMRTALESSMTTIRTQQAQLVRRERLASVGQLLAALAHDLRNPLGVIRSSAQLVLDARRDPAVKEEVARYIIEEVDRLTSRINDFLRYARQKPPEPTMVPADTPLRSALRQWQALGGHEHIQVEIDCAPDQPPILVDTGQVVEALVNLLINAREAMPNGGRLTLKTGQAPSGAVSLTIQDTGCGIPATQIRRIFEPFFTTKEYGTGLGLTNVQRLIEDNGGTMQVDSQEGVGTTFVIYFPTRFQTENRTPNASALEPPGGRLVPGDQAESNLPHTPSHP